jgi:hypothetical protein
MPTLDEIGRELGLSKIEQKSLIRLVDEKVARTRSASSLIAKKRVSGGTRKASPRARASA